MFSRGLKQMEVMSLGRPVWDALWPTEVRHLGVSLVSPLVPPQTVPTKTHGWTKVLSQIPSSFRVWTMFSGMQKVWGRLDHRLRK